MRKIGLIGGVGTGKSQVADLIEKYFKAYVIKADLVGHKLIKKGNISYDLIVDAFGHEILDAHEEIDRTKLGAIVFKDRAKLDLLNQFTHPYIYNYIKAEIKDVSTTKADVYDYIIVEVPLMIEAGFDDLVEELWFVYTDRDVRVQRLKQNRNYSDDKIVEILENQLEDQVYEVKANYIINNSNTLNVTLEQIREILT
jgi:dephospho-CoA kinase